MTRWIVLVTLGTLASATGCGDDSNDSSGTGGAGGEGTTTSTTTGTTTGTTTSSSGGGEGGQGGEGQGGQGGADGCGGPEDCSDTERCDFRDGLCGAGERGTCVELAETCSDDTRVCLCDGSVTDITESCLAFDLDSTGSCELEAGLFACNEKVCDVGSGFYCHVTSDDTGGADYAWCATTDEPSCEDIPTCDCLTAEIEGCNGTCTDGPDGATVRCPGG